jgi:transcriptional regulator with XRE-family HTH domain
MTDEQKLRELLGDLAEDREFQAAMLEEDLISRVALRVLKARKANGLTQAELAKMIGTHQPGIARIEAGESNLRLRTLAQLALALRCEPEALVSERAPRFLEKAATSVLPPSGV